MIDQGKPVEPCVTATEVERRRVRGFRQVITLTTKHGNNCTVSGDLAFLEEQEFV